MLKGKNCPKDKLEHGETETMRRCLKQKAATQNECGCERVSRNCFDGAVRTYLDEMLGAHVDNVLGLGGWGKVCLFVVVALWVVAGVL